MENTIPKLVELDPLLNPFKDVILNRQKKIIEKEKEFTEGGKKQLADAVNGHHFYGLHKTDSHWIFREWAPNATRIFLIGNFSGWQIDEKYELRKTEFGNWEIQLPLYLLNHRDLYHLYICWNGGAGHRLPAYAERVLQDPKLRVFNAQVWDPPMKYEWMHTNPSKVKAPLVYEAHVGMSSTDGRVETYNGFRMSVLPRIAKAGYNVIQLMAIMEHPYYGSFGYHVSNFFGVSSRSGTPDEFKELVDEAHSLGISVIMDIVHSHSVKNEVEGLSCFDGSLYQYFHDGPRGMHQAWDSRCFDYGKNEVLHFLLSNCKYWVEEYHIDGFRFDGITSMLFRDHGLGSDFMSYGQYFNLNQDEDAIVYLALANKLIHQLKPSAITIAEDMSGYPGLCSELEDGGLGFDFRLAMGTPDYWISLIKTQKFDMWHVGDMFYRLTDKRVEEKVISYAESHDQAIVGDQTISFRLMGAEMYNNMSVYDQNYIVENGVAIHKLIRLVTLSCAANGYLNFMGNEFGHPEWIDFPREGNGWSHHYARRQWYLSDNSELRFYYLNNFDRDMIHLVKKHKLLEEPKPAAIVQNIEGQVLVYQRGKLFFVFNFNPNNSYTDYGFEMKKGSYKIVLNSDSFKYNGQNRINEQMLYETIEDSRNSKIHYLRLYIPAKTALVLEKVTAKK